MLFWHQQSCIVFPTASAGIEYYFNRNNNQPPTKMVLFLVSSVCLKWHPIVFFLSVFEAKEMMCIVAGVPLLNFQYIAH